MSYLFPVRVLQAVTSRAEDQTRRLASYRTGIQADLGTRSPVGHGRSGSIKIERYRPP